MSEEWFPIVDENGQTIGKATRKECHNGTMWLHPVVHLHVINNQDELYLQYRPAHKDIQPNRWDTSVGGHVDYGETTKQAVLRETEEELGLKHITPHFAYSYLFESSIERELVYTYIVKGDYTPQPDGEEVGDGRYWSFDEIRLSLGSSMFTPNFEEEFLRLCQYLKDNSEFPPKPIP